MAIKVLHLFHFLAPLEQAVYGHKRSSRHFRILRVESLPHLAVAGNVLDLVDSVQVFRFLHPSLIELEQ